MRTNIDIDDDLMAKAMQAGPYKTKKDAVEAGLKLLARQAAYREVLKWEGKLKWEGDDASDWMQSPAEPSSAAVAQAPAAPAYQRARATAAVKAAKTAKTVKGAKRGRR